MIVHRCTEMRVHSLHVYTKFKSLWLRFKSSFLRDAAIRVRCANEDRKVKQVNKFAKAIIIDSLFGKSSGILYSLLALVQG